MGVGHEKINLVIYYTHTLEAQIDADKESRNFSGRQEWALNKDVCEGIVKLYPNLDVHLLSARLNCQFSTYCLFKPETGSTYVDAFSLD